MPYFLKQWPSQKRKSYMLHFKICALHTVLVGEANCENVNAIISLLLNLPDVFPPCVAGS